MQLKTANNRSTSKTLALLSLIFITSCIRHRPVEVQPSAVESEYLSHKITHSGETLGLISLWYTGDTALWKNFYIPATSGTIRKLKRGDEILIPNKFVTRKEPLSKEFISAHRGVISAKSRITLEKMPPTQKNNQDKTLPQTTEGADPTIKEAIPSELTPLEVEQFEDRPTEPAELEKEFIDRIVK